MKEAEEKDSVKEKKKMSWWRAFLFNRGAEKAFKKENEESGGDAQEDSDKSAKDTRKLNEYLGAIETQLDKVDEQNKILLFHLSTVKENNEALLKQITVLSKNNEQLFQQFQSSKRREKIAKIIAVVASSLAIGFWIYKIIMVILGNGV